MGYPPVLAEIHQTASALTDPVFPETVAGRLVKAGIENRQVMMGAHTLAILPRDRVHDLPSLADLAYDPPDGWQKAPGFAAALETQRERPGATRYLAIFEIERGDAVSGASAHRDRAAQAQRDRDHRPFRR